MLYILVSIYFPQRLRVDHTIHAQHKTVVNSMENERISWENLHGKSWWRNISTTQHISITNTIKEKKKKPNLLAEISKITGINSFPNHITRWQVNIYFFPHLYRLLLLLWMLCVGLRSLMWLEHSHAVIETF